MINKKQIIFWLPRGLAIIFALFMSIFALDSFSGDWPLTQKLAGFFIHLIPSFALFVIILYAWKKSLRAAILFFIITLIFIIYFKLYTQVQPFLIIAGPMLLISFLYLFDALEGGDPDEEKNIRENDKLDEFIEKSS